MVERSARGTVGASRGVEGEEAVKKEYVFPACMIVFIVALILGVLVAANYYMIRSG